MQLAAKPALRLFVVYAEHLVAEIFVLDVLSDDLEQWVHVKLF
jgi:hypothetical protein